MAIFSVIGVALITLLRQSTAFLEKGQSGSELHDIVDAADAMLSDDFANIVVRSATTEGEPDVRLFSDRVAFKADEKVEGEEVPSLPRGPQGVVTHVPRLMFVRSVPGELTDPAMREAGSKVSAQGRLDGFEDEREVDEGDLRAPAGKMEVMYTLLPGKPNEERGVGTLYRGTRTPIGGKESFLPWEPWHDNSKPASRMGLHSRETIEERLRPVANGVLHLSFAFWSRHTRLSDARILVDGEPPRTTPPSIDGGGLSTTWDSTRGILPPGSGLDSFFLARGAASLADPLDDIFPARIRVTLVLQRIGRDARSADLAQSLSDSDTEVRVEDTSFAPGGDPLSRYIKIDDEWMRWDSRTSRSFQIAERGARGTVRASHEAGARVHAGAALVRDYRVPVYKEDWND